MGLDISKQAVGLTSSEEFKCPIFTFYLLSCIHSVLTLSHLSYILYPSPGQSELLCRFKPLFYIHLICSVSQLHTKYCSSIIQHLAFILYWATSEYIPYFIPVCFLWFVLATSWKLAIFIKLCEADDEDRKLQQSSRRHEVAICVVMTALLLHPRGRLSPISALHNGVGFLLILPLTLQFSLFYALWLSLVLLSS